MKYMSGENLGNTQSVGRRNLGEDAERQRAGARKVRREQGQWFVTVNDGKIIL